MPLAVQAAAPLGPRRAPEGSCCRGDLRPTWTRGTTLEVVCQSASGCGVAHWCGREKPASQSRRGTAGSGCGLSPCPNATAGEGAGSMSAGTVHPRRTALQRPDLAGSPCRASTFSVPWMVPRMIESPGSTPPPVAVPTWPRAAALRALVAGIGLAAAATATVGPDAARWFGVRGPHCLLGACLGSHACPGCGLVRATAAAVQGDFATAWGMHPAGVVVAALLPLSLAVNLDILRRGRALASHDAARRLGHLAFVVAVVAGFVLRLTVCSSTSLLTHP